MNHGRKKLPLGKNGKEVWANTCQNCSKWLKQGDLKMDHISPVGGMKTLDDAGRWLKNSLVEMDGWQRLCKICHDKKTAQERKK